MPSGETWITFRTDDATNARLDRLAAALGLTRSELMRRMVRRALRDAEWLGTPAGVGAVAGSADGRGGR